MNHKELYIELRSGLTNDHNILAATVKSFSYFLLYVRYFRVNKINFDLRKHGVAAWTLRHPDEARVCPKLLLGPHHEAFGVEAVTALRLPDKIQDFEVFDTDSTGGVGVVL